VAEREGAAEGRKEGLAILCNKLPYALGAKTTTKNTTISYRGRKNSLACTMIYVDFRVPKSIQRIDSNTSVAEMASVYSELK
jgi:hypothetical protein